MAKKYYWLKLKVDFFDDKHIKFIRSLADGDKMLIVYLRMQLLSLKAEGIIKYERILPSCTDEIALQIDEPLEIINKTIETLVKVNLIEVCDDESLYLNAVNDVIGSETDAAKRMREKRARDSAGLNYEQNTTESNDNFTPWVQP